MASKQLEVSNGTCELLVTVYNTLLAPSLIGSNSVSLSTIRLLLLLSIYLPLVYT